MQIKKGQKAKKTSVFNTEGKEFKVTHQIDVKDWLDAGYTLVDPKGKVPQVDEPIGAMTEEEFDQVKDGLKALNAEELKRVATFLEVDYTNMKETLVAIEALQANDL